MASEVLSAKASAIRQFKRSIPPTSGGKLRVKSRTDTTAKLETPLP